MIQLNLSELMDYDNMKVDDLDLYKNIINYIKYGDNHVEDYIKYDDNHVRDVIEVTENE